MQTYCYAIVSLAMCCDLPLCYSKLNFTNSQLALASISVWFVAFFTRLLASAPDFICLVYLLYSPSLYVSRIILHLFCFPISLHSPRSLCSFTSPFTDCLINFVGCFLATRSWSVCTLSSASISNDCIIRLHFSFLTLFPGFSEKRVEIIKWL